MVIERQVIVTWYTPEEKLPPDGLLVVVTASGRYKNVHYKNALAIGEYYAGDGWYVDGKCEGLTVSAWADLEAYGGGK